MSSVIALLIVSAGVIWAGWQLGWRGGKKEHGRDSLSAGGGGMPFW